MALPVKAEVPLHGQRNYYNRASNRACAKNSGADVNASCGDSKRPSSSRSTAHRTPKPSGTGKLTRVDRTLANRQPRSACAPPSVFTTAASSRPAPARMSTCVVHDHSRSMRITSPSRGHLAQAGRTVAGRRRRPATAEAGRVAAQLDVDCGCTQGERCWPGQHGPRSKASAGLLISMCKNLACAASSGGAGAGATTGAAGTTVDDVAMPVRFWPRPCRTCLPGGVQPVCQRH